MAKLGGKALTAEIRKLLETQHEDSAFTKNERLAELIVKQALGYTEKVRDEMGTEVTKTHPPVAWAQQFIFERVEGKSPVAAPDNDGAMKAADKVRQLSKDRVNALAAKIVPSGPPKKAGKK